VLEPLRQEHEQELLEAAQDGEIWQLWYTTATGPDAIFSYVNDALKARDEEGEMPFVVRRKSDGKVVGSSRYMNVDAKNRRLGIGGTWYGKAAQRTGINTEAKLIMLKHAFETLDCIAVEFRTHWFNFDSRAAIARLGAKQDGVLRNHQLAPNGTLRDTVVFSIIASEWPTVKAHLRWLLNKPRVGVPARS
jgi:RimJ/RimL family protein N-acetyltransferase